MRKNVIVPNLLNQVIIDGTLIPLFQCLSLLISPLNQYGPEIVYPSSSFLCCSGFQVKSSLLWSDRKAKRIKVSWDFVLSHHSRANTQSQICNVINQNKPWCLILRWICNPLNFGLIFTQEDSSLHKFIWSPANLQKNISFDKILTDFYSFFDIINCKILQPTIYSSKIISLSLKLFLSNPVKDVRQIFFSNRWTRSSGISNKLFHSHFPFLFGIMSISCQHNDGIG